MLSKAANILRPSARKFSSRPIIVNTINDLYVLPGKEKIVGLWLLTVSASVFSIVVIGGYTRLSKSGLSMVKWKPHGGWLPRGEEAWNKEFEEYKEYPEYQVMNKDMDLDGFKRIYFVEWFHRMVGRSIGLIFTGPMIYFWARGYLKYRLKIMASLLLGLGALQGGIGWWMVKSGLVDKTKTNAVDKTPRVSPYRLSVHAGFAYAIYGIALWQAMHLLRRPQEDFINHTNILHHNIMRNKLRRGFLFLLAVYLTGYLVAGNAAGVACNTFPKVGPDWFIKSKHFNYDIPFWKNFTENKLVIQVIHRTLACGVATYFIYQITSMMKLNLIPRARYSILLLSLVLAAQVYIGIKVVHKSVPVELGSLHQVGAMTLLTASLIALHS
jgi:heme a synthase